MGLLTRVYTVNGYELWKKAKDCLKINIISTDNIFGKCWTNFLYNESGYRMHRSFLY